MLHLRQWMQLSRRWLCKPRNLLLKKSRQRQLWRSLPGATPTARPISAAQLLPSWSILQVTQEHRHCYCVATRHEVGHLALVDFRSNTRTHTVFPDALGMRAEGLLIGLRVLRSPMVRGRDSKAEREEAPAPAPVAPDAPVAEEEVDYEADDLPDEAAAAPPAEPTPSEARPPRARSESKSGAPEVRLRMRTLLCQQDVKPRAQVLFLWASTPQAASLMWRSVLMSQHNVVSCRKSLLQAKGRT